LWLARGLFLPYLSNENLERYDHCCAITLHFDLPNEP